MHPVNQNEAVSAEELLDPGFLNYAKQLDLDKVMQWAKAHHDQVIRRTVIALTARAMIAEKALEKVEKALSEIASLPDNVDQTKKPKRARKSGLHDFES